MPSLTNLLIPTYKQNLTSLSKWLDKKGVQDLLDRRLAPDMFPLSTQVRFICLQAHEGVCRLQPMVELPSILKELDEEGRAFKDGTVTDTVEKCKARIQQTLDFLEALDESTLDKDGAAERSITLQLGELTFVMTGEQYARDWALPQFYFHVVAAYSILRNAGVDMGKADYVPHMFAYLQPASDKAAEDAPPSSK